MPPVNRPLPFAGLPGAAFRFLHLALIDRSTDAPPPTPLELATAAYARQLKLLLPPGLLWLLEADSEITHTLEAIATELARVDARSLDLIEETDPRTTSELLEDWERVLGLPDGCVLELPTTIADRRAALVQKLLTRGGQTPGFFVAMAAAVGATARVLEHRPAVLRSGSFRSGDRCYGAQWVHIWTLDTSNSLAAGVALAAPEDVTCGRTSQFGGNIHHDADCNYRVVAVNSSGTSFASARANGTPGGGTNTNTMRVGWSPVDGAASYQIFADYAGGTEQLVGTSTTSLFLDFGFTVPTGLPPLDAPAISSAIWAAAVGGVLPGGVECVYRVTALNAAGETYGSVEVAVTPGAGTNTNTTQVNWGPLVGATAGYRIYGRTRDAARLIGQVAAGVSFFVDTGVFEPHLYPPTANTARADRRGTSKKGQALECAVRRASPGHSTVVFEYEE